jgi:hypothetical protein
MLVLLLLLLLLLLLSAGRCMLPLLPPLQWATAAAPAVLHIRSTCASTWHLQRGAVMHS